MQFPRARAVHQQLLELDHSDAHAEALPGFLFFFSLCSARVCVWGGGQQKVATICFINNRKRMHGEESRRQRANGRRQDHKGDSRCF